jgi:hypothetical protein
MKLFLAAIVLMIASIAVPARAGDVKVQLANGRITLQARDATLREILAEWARVGQVTIVNAERVMSAPLTLDLQGVPETQALNILLRSVSGYMAAPKAQATATASMYDRIVILAAPRPATVNAGYTPPTPQQPPQYRGVPGMPNATALDDQEDPAGPPPTYPGGPPVYPGAAAPRGMGVQQGQPGPQTMPTMPGTLPQGAPGTISPMPQIQGVPGQPGMVVQPGTGAPGTVSQPVKKPGGPGGPGGDGGQL